MLSFAGENHHWQDIVLGVFNPLVITAMMRTIYCLSDEYGPIFDEMRNQFNYRHEFEDSRILTRILSAEDRLLLEKLGLRICVHLACDSYCVNP